MVSRRPGGRKRSQHVLLQQLTAALSRAVTMEEVAEVAVTRGMQAVGGQMAMLCIVSRDGTSLELLRSANVPDPLFPYIQHIPLHLPGPLTDAILTRQPIWIQSLEEYQTRYPRLVQMSHSATLTEAVACLPMLIHDRAIGGMTISFLKRHRFNATDRELMIALANQCAQALERARLYAAEHTARTMAEALSTTATILNSTLDLSQVLDHILVNVRRVVSHDAADISLLEGDQARIVRKQGHEKYAEFLPALPLIQRMIQTQQPLLIADTHDTEPFRAFLGVPIMGKAQIIGFLNLYSLRPGFFEFQHVAWLKVFAEQAATAIQNARLYEQAQQLAVMEERQRLARDLHDAVSQMLFTSSMIAEALPRLSRSKSDKFEHYLDQLYRLNRGAYAEMRNLLLELNQENLKKMTIRDLLQQLTQAAVGRAPLKIELQVDDTVVLQDEVLVTFYRVAQEALNNIIKHARASAVQITVKQQHNSVELLIRDNGAGFDKSSMKPSNLGLRIMTERAQAIQAQVEVDSIPGKGTAVCLRWSPDPSRAER
jgi:signal transduction histidine kinase